MRRNDELKGAALRLYERNPIRIILFGLLYVFDGWVAGQGVLIALVAIIAVGQSLVGGLWRKEPWTCIIERASIPVVASLLAWGTIRFHIHHATERARQVVQACEKFHEETGVYPKDLDALVPTYLPRVPRAKYTLMLNSFQYYALKDEHLLIWVVIPPFGRRTYSFEHKSWGSLD